MTADACAAIVQRDDPRLYKTALFACEPGRSRLMVVYAFDIELSRATRASKESLIPRMRLQWWRDVIDGASTGDQPKAHDVAGPMASMIREEVENRPQPRGPACTENLEGLIRARESTELDLPIDQDRYEAWTIDRFRGLILAARWALDDTKARNVGSGPESAAAPVLGAAFAIRNARRMAAEQGATLLPNLTGTDVAALARGALTEKAAQIVRETARSSLSSLADMRRTQRKVEGNLIPAYLPLLWAERSLHLVVKDPAAIFGQLDDIDRPFDGLRLAWRALRGRW